MGALQSRHDSFNFTQVLTGTHYYIFSCLISTHTRTNISVWGRGRRGVLNWLADSDIHWMARGKCCKKVVPSYSVRWHNDTERRLFLRQHSTRNVLHQQYVKGHISVVCLHQSNVHVTEPTWWAQRCVSRQEIRSRTLSLWYVMACTLPIAVDTGGHTKHT